MYMKKSNKNICVVGAMLHVHVKFKLELFFLQGETKETKSTCNRCGLRIHMNSASDTMVCSLSFLFLLVQNLVQAQILHEYVTLHHLHIYTFDYFFMHILMYFFEMGAREH